MMLLYKKEIKMKKKKKKELTKHMRKSLLNLYESRIKFI